MEWNKKKLQEMTKNFSVKKLKKDQLLILFLVGVLLLVIAIPTGSKKSGEEQSDALVSGSEKSASSDQNAYAAYMERHLEDVLSELSGAGEVTVMITLKSSGQKVIEKDTEASSEVVTESDSQGGTRSTKNTSHGESTVYSGDGSQSQVPYVSEEKAPEVEGVVVLAQGGGDSVVKQNITEAVQALFGIDTHKIRIMKKN